MKKGNFMQYILCYGDSNTWGYAPQTMARYDFDVRWPGILQKEMGAGYHIYENALNGRTTVFQDPIEEGRCGKEGLPVVLQSCAPLDAVIIMLGTNDCKKRFSLDPWDIGWGMDLLIQYVKRADCGRHGAAPSILIVSPPAMGTQWDQTILGTVFGKQAAERAARLPEIYHEIAQRSQVDFLDASPLTTPGSDCVHLDPDSHDRLGKAIADKMRIILKQ